MRSVVVETVRSLRFDDGSPVRAASAISVFADGWLVAQDDAAHAAWVRPDSVSRVRLVPPVEGHDVFSAESMKHLKPDFEAGCPVEVDGEQGVLLLGSGSAPARRRAVVVLGARRPRALVADLTPLYEQIGRQLGRGEGELNLEGACQVDGVLRWFARGNLAAGLPSASVDVDPRALVAAVAGGTGGAAEVQRPWTYDLGTVDGVGLEVTDAVALPGGRMLLTASAEDAPNAVDDGPVVASALALVEGDRVVATLTLPEVGGVVRKVEGLAVLQHDRSGVQVLAVVDDDDDDAASMSLVLRVLW